MEKENRDRRESNRRLDRHWPKQVLRLKQRYGKFNEHNVLVPRDHWLEDHERQRILDFQPQHPLAGYRRLAYMMMDADVVGTSPATVYRVLKSAGLMSRWNQKTNIKKMVSSYRLNHTSMGMLTWRA